MITAVPFVQEGYPADLVAKSRSFLLATLAMFPPGDFLRGIVRHLFARHPLHAERATTAANFVGVDPLDLFAGNLCYDFFTTARLKANGA